MRYYKTEYKEKDEFALYTKHEPSAFPYEQTPWMIRLVAPDGQIIATLRYATKAEAMRHMSWKSWTFAMNFWRNELQRRKEEA